MTTTATAERAARGAAWLDEVRPGWADQIDLVELDMRSCASCLIGQLWPGDSRDYGFWRDAVRRAGLRLRYGRGGGPTDRDLGFNIFGGEDWHELQSAWLDLIYVRRTSS